MIYWIIIPFDENYVEIIPEAILAWEPFIDLSSHFKKVEGTTLKSVSKNKELPNLLAGNTKEYSVLYVQSL